MARAERPGRRGAPPHKNQTHLTCFPRTRNLSPQGVLALSVEDVSSGRLRVANADEGPRSASCGFQGPVAIGGVGGSGTRIVAQLIQELGYFLGDHLNISRDNIDFTVRFVRPDIREIPSSEFNALVDEFTSGLKTAAQAAGATCWGWKEPNTHVIIDRIMQFIPSLNYIHVVRDGFDMALSPNQNQADIWGEQFLGISPDAAVSPRYSLKYWCSSHRRIERLIEQTHLSHRIFIIDYETLCEYPERALQDLLRFTRVSVPDQRLRQLGALVKPPKSRGRGGTVSLDIFDAADVEYATSVRKGRR